MNANILIAILFLIFGIFLKWFLHNTRKSRNHNYKIRSAERVYDKLQSFTGQYRSQQIITYLRKINAYAFEELVLTALQRKGYSIKRSKSYSGDGGCDGHCYLNGKHYILQMKRYKNTVSAKHLSEFNLLIKKSGAEGGFFVHTGKTSAVQFSNFKSSSLQIISGERLINLIVIPLSSK